LPLCHFWKLSPSYDMLQVNCFWIIIFLLGCICGRNPFEPFDQFHIQVQRSWSPEGWLSELKCDCIYSIYVLNHMLNDYVDQFVGIPSSPPHF
jgi:hypothetical protein